MVSTAAAAKELIENFAEGKSIDDLASATMATLNEIGEFCNALDIDVLNVNLSLSIDLQSTTKKSPISWQTSNHSSAER